MPASYTDRLIEELMRDMLAVLPEDDRPVLESKLRPVVFATFDGAREVIDAAAERFPDLCR